MNNNVALVYENGEFKISMNGSVVKSERELNLAVEKFKQVLTSPVSPEQKSWECIESEMIQYIESGLEINNEFKTLAFGPMKYFYITGKVLYTAGSMIDLKGGYNLFKFAMDIVSKGDKEKCGVFIELCKQIIENKAILSINDDTMVIRSAKLSYGALEYNFTTEKINKGTSVEKGSFEEFKEYCISSLIK